MNRYPRSVPPGVSPRSDWNKAEKVMSGVSTSFSFRVDSGLKKSFSDICKEEQYSVSVALKRYMALCIKSGTIV